jgi:magnesium-transporting ATPase (P-type)
MGFLLGQILVFLCGIAAIVFSALTWRLKKDIFFYLGLGFTAIYSFYAIYNYKFIVSLFNQRDILFLMFNLAFIVIPVYFLISSKLQGREGNTDKGIDGIQEGGPVTEEYLDEIINSPDEEVDFEDDYDLK